MSKYIITEDGIQRTKGSVVYNYYDMKPGRIVDLDTDFQHGQEGDLKNGLWFSVRHDDGSTSYLNGARICSMDFALKRGFSGAYREEDIIDLFNRLHLALEREGDYDDDIDLIANRVDAAQHDYMQIKEATKCS
jgi:hypothetical protein